jgi:YVTN family beta-propeller protein
MKKKNFIRALALCMTVTVPLFTACKDDDGPADGTPVMEEYIYVLNSGDIGSNNASLSMYGVKDGAVTGDVFEVRNGRRLGDTGQDLVVYGSKMYIAVYGESRIEVTDLDAKSIRPVTTEGQPRSFAVDGGKVYVTYHNGYVARLDTSSLEVEATVRVGRNPEQLTVANGKLYVANSGGLDFNTETGYDRTVSVIDIASFTETKKIEVIINPYDIVSDAAGNSVYVVSKGNYVDIPNTLQKIDTRTDAVSVMTDVNGTFLSVMENTLYTIHSQYDAEWNQVINIYAYDMAGGRLLSGNFTGSTAVDKAFSISSSAAAGLVFIGASDYLNDGDVYMFDKSGVFEGKFEVGLNPMKAVYVKKQ